MRGMRFNSWVLNNVLDILTELCNRNVMPEFGGRKAGIVGTETNSLPNIIIKSKSERDVITSIRTLACVTFGMSSGRTLRAFLVLYPLPNCESIGERRWVHYLTPVLDR